MVLGHFHIIKSGSPGKSLDTPALCKKKYGSGSFASAWRLLIDNFILKHIAKCTITEAHCILQNQNFELTIKELKTFIALMYARGVTGKSALSLHDIWIEKMGVPLCKNDMSRNRFCKILQFIRFEIKSSRLQKLQTNKFVLFSEI